jgi:hypothetical protein
MKIIVTWVMMPCRLLIFVNSSDKPADITFKAEEYANSVKSVMDIGRERNGNGIRSEPIRTGIMKEK